MALLDRPQITLQGNQVTVDLGKPTTIEMLRNETLAVLITLTELELFKELEK